MQKKQINNKTTKLPKKFIKKSEKESKERDRIQREIKVQQVLLRRKDIISCFAFSFIQMCVCQSVVVFVRLQDARRGERLQAAVPQQEQRGQQRGRARGPSGDSRVFQDGVGRTWTVYLRVLRERRTGEGEVSEVCTNSNIPMLTG